MAKREIKATACATGRSDEILDYVRDMETQATVEHLAGVRMIGREGTRAWAAR